MSETLKACIGALIDRKLAILAELAAIDADLHEGARVLGTIPSVRAAATAPVPQVVVPTLTAVPKPKGGDRRKKHPLVCPRCQDIKPRYRTSKFCDDCRPLVQREHMQALHREGVLRKVDGRSRAWVEQLDARLAAGAAS